MAGTEATSTNMGGNDITTMLFRHLLNNAQVSGNGTIQGNDKKVEQHQNAIFGPLFYLGLAGGFGQTASDMLTMLHGQNKPKEYRNQEQLKLNQAATEGLQLSRNIASGMQQQAYNMANKIGNKAIEAVMARNANTGMGSNSAAAAAGEFAKDLAYSNLSMDAYNRAGMMAKSGYDTYAAQMAQSSDLTQNLMPGEGRKKTLLEAIGRLPAIYMTGLNTQAEATTKNTFKYGLGVSKQNANTTKL